VPGLSLTKYYLRIESCLFLWHSAGIPGDLYAKQGIPNRRGGLGSRMAVLGPLLGGLGPLVGGLGPLIRGLGLLAHGLPGSL